MISNQMRELVKIEYPFPPVDEALAEKVAQYIRDGQPLSITGREGVLEELEDEFAKAHGGKYVLAMSSGTISLLAAFVACGLKPADEVIVTAYSYHATVSPLMHLGVKIIFCDVEPDTGNLAVEKLRQLINNNTKAVVTNHNWGHPVDADGIREVLNEQSQKVYWIEDCSHAHFGSYKGKLVGNFGDVSCFSLQGHKMLPAGEGGLLMTRSEEIHDAASIFSYSLCRTEGFLILPKYRSLGRTGLGLKHRIHPLAALVALHHLKHNIRQWIKDRNRLMNKMSQGLKEIPGIIPPVDRSYVTSRGAFYGYKSIYDGNALPKCPDRVAFIEALKNEGLRVKLPGSPPMYQLPLFNNSPFPLRSTVAPVPEKGLIGAETYYNSIITMPVFTFPKEEEIIEAYIEIIRETAARFI